MSHEVEEAPTSSYPRPTGQPEGEAVNRPTRSIASRMRSVGAVTEKRTYPSPAGPKKEPGATTTLVSSSRARARRYPLWASRESLDRRLLERAKQAGVDVGLHLGQGGQCCSVADGHAQTPTGHVEGLGQGVELHRNLLRSWSLQDAGRPVAIVGDVTVRCMA